LEDINPDTTDFAASFKNSPYFDVVILDTSRHRAEEMLTASHIRAVIIMPASFQRDTFSRDRAAPIQVITDGSEPNTANFLENYIQGVWQNWLDQKKRVQGEIFTPPIQIEQRIWYNPAGTSRFFLLPGSIAIVMTIIGTLLTALVVAREWERGTMEALMSTPVSIWEILAGKLVPYFILGMGSLIVCVAFSIVIFEVPFRGSFWLLLVVSSLFLYAALSLGLLISTLAKNQFVASQTALYSAFLPAFLLSGFIFEVDSMPVALQLLSYLLPAKYFVKNLQTLFLAGNVYKLILINCAGIFIIGTVFLTLILRQTRKRLD
jgi:ABC-2 type transport system permease protein